MVSRPRELSSHIASTVAESSPVRDINQLQEFAERLAVIEDLSLWSRGCHDLATTSWQQFLLDPARAAIVRPLGIRAGDRVLELGCGAGALTRYLGELGAEVLALEEDVDLVAMAAIRCQGLTNVKLLQGRLGEVEFLERFDWILLIDATLPQHRSAPTRPLEDDLALCRPWLNEGGRLVLAIDNVFALRALQAGPEAPRGGRYAAISGGRLCQVLTEQGLANKQFYYPFPDHRLTDVIIAEQGLQEDGFDAAGLLIQARHQRYQEESLLAFDTAPVYAELSEDPFLLAEWSNAFLVVAAPDPDTSVRSSALAWVYGSDCVPQLARETVFLRVDESLRVERRPLLEGAGERAVATAAGQVVMLNCDTWDYRYGPGYVAGCLDALSRAATPAACAAMLQPWFDWLIAAAGLARPIAIDATVSGTLLDATPWRLIDTRQGFEMTPSCWQIENEVPLIWVVARGVMAVLRGILRLCADELDVGQVVQALYSTRGLACPESEIRAWARWQSGFESGVTGREVEADDLLRPCRQGNWIYAEERRLASANIALSLGITRRDEALVELQQDLDERTERAAELNRRLAERDSWVRGLEEQLTERTGRIDSLEARVRELETFQHSMLNSTSWRLTAPLRTCIHQVRRVQALVHVLPRLVADHGGALRAPWRLFHLGVSAGRQGLIDALRAAARLDAQQMASATVPLAPIDMPVISTQADTATAKAPPPEQDYVEWVRRYDSLDEAARSQLVRRIEALPARPVLSLVLMAGPDGAAGSVASIRRQIYPHWRLLVPQAVYAMLEGRDERIRCMPLEADADPTVQLTSAFATAQDDWLLVLPSGAELAEHALYWLVDAMLTHPEARLIYADEDRIDADGGRHRPLFKSDFNYDLLLAQHYFGSLIAYRRELVAEVGGVRAESAGAELYDLSLRCIESIAPEAVVHIPRVLVHRRESRTLPSGSQVTEAGRRAVVRHLGRRNVAGTAHMDEANTAYRVDYALPDPRPLVSILIPTRDRLSLLRACVAGILERTTYGPYEIIIIDNDSEDPATLVYLEDLQRGDPRVRVLQETGPFNYSRLNNVGARAARGEVLALVNNDVEVITQTWLDEMVSVALQEGVGAVGARLWYPNDTLQHAGVVLGIGYVAGHVHKDLARTQEGYAGRARLRQNFSAVTGACLVVRKRVFEAVGGLDDINLPVAFNDVDFCLRLRAARYRNVWMPTAELYHHEAASRGKDSAPARRKSFGAEVAYMKQRWGESLRSDPYYNPNLTLRRTDFSFAWPPRVELLGFASSGTLT